MFTALKIILDKHFQKNYMFSEFTMLSLTEKGSNIFENVIKTIILFLKFFFLVYLKLRQDEVDFMKI